MKRFLYRLIYCILIIIIIICSIYIYNFIRSRYEAEEESNLINAIVVNENDIEESSNDFEKEEIINSENERILKVKKLKEINEDIVGWLEIKGTDISYPVLQGTDNSYYMTHNYKKTKSKNGSIFLDKDYDWSIKSNNLLIYGHNLNNGKMFQDLLKYKDEEYYKAHNTIRFTTDSEDNEYEIMAVFKSRVYFKSEKNVFRYYQFINPKTEKEYNEFIQDIKKASLYNTKVNSKYGDELITLSTCSYHTKDGRFAVVGVKKGKE